MEPNGQYLGALDAYVAAPFVGIFGTNLLAIRLPLAIVGGAYVAVMYWLGKVLFKRTDYALLTALVAAVFPLFTVYWGGKLRGGYTELPIFEAIALALCAKIGWGHGSKLRYWAALGVTTGVALWSDLLFIVVAAVVLLGLLLRGPTVGWPAWRRGAGVGLIAGVVGLAPWLAFNLPNNLASLHSIPKNYVGFRTGVGNLLSEHLPILVGGSSSCGHDVVPALVSDSLLGLLAVTILVMRRQTLARVFRGRFTSIEPIDLVYLALPATLIFLVVSRLNYDPCQPRYVTPLAVPLVIAVVTILAARWPWRSIGLPIAAAWLVISGLAAAGPLVDMQPTTPTGAAVPSDLGAGLAMINRENPSAVWAQYWLSRPLSYYSGDMLVIGDYGGYVGFVQRQQHVETAATPSWAFVAGDAETAVFERVCANRNVTFNKVEGGGLVLYTHLSATVEPQDVFIGSEAKTS
jgi:4-amino-4-deoxy-L-arabinose transferase-like glycosyltransferase